MNNMSKRLFSFTLAVIFICTSVMIGVSELALNGFLVFESKALNVYNASASDIVLPSDLLPGIYTLRYENSSGVVPEYGEICTFEVDNYGEEVVYDRFIDVNTAPIGAVVIGIYNEDNEKVGQIDLKNLSTPDYGEKLYSFAAFSDVHIGSKTAEEDFQNALEYVENNHDVAFTAICGDLVHSVTETTQLETYKNLVDSYTTKPVYAISGNHEAGSNNLTVDELKPYTGQDIYYSFTYGNDVYIMLGITGCTRGNLFDEGALQWLYETLEANKDKRCFLFQHVRPNQGSGNPWNIYDYGIWGDVEAKVFESILAHYPNVIFFHGHTHMTFNLQTKDNLANYDNLFGYHSVHIPSLSRPRTGDERGPVSRKELTDESEGYIIDVYENGIVLKGRDFIEGKFLPIANYALDTTTKPVDAGTYYDSTGTIINDNCNVLKEGDEWYNSATPKNAITEISFVKEYEGTPDEKWTAGLNDSSVIVYREGSQIFIVGNVNGIVANTNSAEMFKDFTNLIAINGFENLEKANITTIEGMFKNCNSLNNVDFSSFVNVQPVNMAKVFSNCYSLEEIDLSYLDLSVAKQYLEVFANCTSLKKVIFGNVNTATVYMSGSFKGCSSIESVDLSGFGTAFNLGSTFSGCTSLKTVSFPESFKVLALNSCFNGCVSLESLDISGFDVSATPQMNSVFMGCTSLKTLILPDIWDTSNVTTMYQMFYNCPSLIIDCSDWNIINQVDLTAFKVGSPNVTAPYHIEKTEIKEPTCTEQGYIIHSCDVCGYNYTDSYVMANGHESSDWIIDESATCTTNGFKHKQCEVCGVTTQNAIITAAGHTVVKENEISASCTTSGKTEGGYCSVCDTVLIVQTVVPATGHTASNWIVDKTATCTAKGSKHKECTDCGETLETQSIPATGHTASDWIIDEVATCTANGSKHKECIDCGETLETQSIPATGHTVSVWIIDKKATVNAAGSQHKECTICGEVLETAVIPQLKPATPKLTKIANTASGVQVTWGKVTGADNYIVYRKTYDAKAKKWGGWTNLGKTTSASYVDKTAKSGTYYLYTVKAVNEAGASGYDKTGIKTYFLARPTVSATNSNSGVTVKWTKLAGATGYYVYRKTTGGWTRIATVKGAGTVSYTDKTAKAGVTYRYTVKAYYSSYASAYVANGFAVRRLTTPTLKSVTSAKAGVTTKWNKVTGATGYIVYRKTGNGSWVKLATVTGNSKVSYLDKTAKKGVTYTYTVKAYYGTSTSYYNTKGLSIKDKY